MDSDNYVAALTRLNSNEDYRMILARIKMQFGDRLRILAECDKEEAEKHRGVVGFMLDQYRELSNGGNIYD